MKKITLLMFAAALSGVASAQNDSSSVAGEKRDTIRIGNIIIVKKGKQPQEKDNDNVEITMGRKARGNAKTTTNWFVMDLGFSNYTDKTDYSNTGNYLVSRPGYATLGKGDFKLRTGKSLNVNIWIVMQRLSLYKNHLNLKYGLGLELNNYRYKSPLSYSEGGTIPYSGGMQTSDAFIFRDSIAFSKNKLAADYVTVPLMLNFTSHPWKSNKGVRISAGVSAGYLYSQRNKQKSEERGKQRNKGEYDMERFKLSYIAELGLGPVKLYGSYSPKSMYEHSLDIRPYTVGFRFGNL